SFEILQAEAFIIKVNDKIICEGMELVKPTYEIKGTCYPLDLESIERTKEYYLTINNQKINFENLTTSDLLPNEYELKIEVGNNPNYKNIIIENAKYLVNKKSINSTLDNSLITVTKQQGINHNLELYCNKKNIDEKIFDETQKVELVFDLALKNNQEIVSVNGSVIKVKYKVDNVNNFKIYSINGEKLSDVLYTINNDEVIFMADNNDTIFAFVYERTKVSLIGFSIIMILVSLVEIFLAIKIFNFRFGKMYGVCTPIWLLIYIENFDLFLFLISLWILIFSTLILIYSIKENKQKITIKPNDDCFTKEDEDLFNFIMKNKKDDDYELEEIL
ncbi:MAG: hypothetical protein IJW82_06240, partial [Clostridia bacterium]|nr:hypothetical protein [Clostridia bacterium]